MIDWPSEDWSAVDIDELGWSQSAMDAVWSYLEERNTDEWVLLHNGRVVRHEQVHSCDPRSDVFAVQKSVMAILVGVAIDRGLLDVNDSVSRFLPRGWTATSEHFESNLTLRHLLTMTTGMSDELSVLGDVGVSWRYNNTAYNYLKRILCELTGRDLQPLTMAWLGEAIGWEASCWIEREQTLPDGRAYTGLEMSALDMARLGLLVLGEGTWNQHVVVANREYWRAMFAPGSDENPAWGYYWWRNDQAQHKFPFIDRTFSGPVIPQAPSDLVMAMGAMDNRVYVVPSLGVVCVRRGKKALGKGEKGSFDQQLWTHLSALWS